MHILKLAPTAAGVIYATKRLYLTVLSPGNSQGVLGSMPSRQGRDDAQLRLKFNKLHKLSTTAKNPIIFKGTKRPTDRTGR